MDMGMNMENFNFDLLPIEMILMIFSYLKISEIINCYTKRGILKRTFNRVHLYNQEQVGQSTNILEELNISIFKILSQINIGKLKINLDSFTESPTDIFFNISKIKTLNTLKLFMDKFIKFPVRAKFNKLMSLSIYTEHQKKKISI